MNDETNFDNSYVKDDPVQTLQNFSTSTNFRVREMYPLVLNRVLETESPELLLNNKEEILKTLEAIANDEKVEVRDRLLGSGNMIKICNSITKLEQIYVSSFGVFLIDHILSIVLKYMSDEDPRVRRDANSTLLYLVEKRFFKVATIKRTIYPVILELLNIELIEAKSSDYDIQINAIGIMAKIAPIIGPEKTHELFFDKFIELITSNVHNIRKKCVSVFPVMCEVLGSDLMESKMLPIFVKLCEHPAWSTRCACAEILPMISILCSLELRRKYLVPIMKKFMFDESRWVIMAALNSLGEFLASFAQPSIIGLAYNYRFDLIITNAADQDFHQQYQANMLFYSNQPNSSEIFKNLEHYEKEFEKEYRISHLSALPSSFLPGSMVPTENIGNQKIASTGQSPIQSQQQQQSAQSVQSGANLTVPPAKKKLNIETYLLSMMNTNQNLMNTSGSGRLSSTTASESDECELFSLQNDLKMRRLSSTQDGESEPEENQEKSLISEALESDEDSFCKFLKISTPFKNNFMNNRLLKISEAHEYSSLSLENSLLPFGNHRLPGDIDDDDDDDDITDFDSLNKASVQNYGIDNDADDDANKEKQDDAAEESKGQENGSGDTNANSTTNGTSNNYNFDDLLDKKLVSLTPPSASLMSSSKTAENDTLNNNQDQDDNFDDLPPPPPALTDDFNDSFERKLDCLTLRDKLNNNELETSAGEDDLEEYNSHQYWYIKPTEIELEVNDNKASVEKPEIVVNGSSNESLDSTLVLHDDDDNESNDSMKVNYNNCNSLKMQIFNDQSEVAENDKDMEKFTHPEIEWNLIEDFVYMKEISNDLCFKCAYNFPAVLLTLGKRFWPLLHQHFLSLCNDLQCSVGVRLTMAKSIYQIALIIGSEQATKDLVPPFIEFFKDIDEITIEVVKLLANFIKIVDGSKHESIINQLEICLMPPINIVNWRLREQIAIQIIELNKISQKIQKENCVLYLTGLALKLMLDKYDCVRKAGMDAFVSCCEKIKQKKQLLKFIAFHFAGSPRWRERQVYVMTVEKLLAKRAIKPELFNNYVLKKLLELATDKIANIRLCVARCLSSSVMENAYYSSDLRESKKQILQYIKGLEEDVDQDVRDSVYNPNKIPVRLPTPPPEKDDVNLDMSEQLPMQPPSLHRRPIHELSREDFIRAFAELDLNFGS